MSNKKVLVTGAGGFVGTHLVKALQEHGDYDIFAGVYKAGGEISTLLPGDHVFPADLTDFAAAEQLIKTTNPDLIFHLAALSVVHSSAKEATSVLNANTTLQYNLLEAIKMHVPTARLVAICSGNVYGAVDPGNLPIKETAPFRPLNPYAVSKATQELLALSYCLAYDLDIVLLRPFNHTGEGQTTDFVIPMLAKQFAAIEKGAPATIEVGNLETSRDFTDVKDMVKAYILAAQKCLKGEAYNIGSGRAYSVRELLDLFQKLTGKSVEIKQKASQVRLADVPVLLSDSTKFRGVTGWTPTIPFEETLSRILNYWRKQT